MRTWILNKAIDAHLRDPRSTEHGPAHSSFYGWFYFRVLCGIKG